jgi:hypothetical protein
MIRGAADDVCAIFDLLVSLPARLFGGDRHRHAMAVGFDERYAALALRGAGDAAPEKYGRADMVYDGNRFRLVEVNVGSELGGIELGEASRALLDVDAFRAFADAHKLSYVDTVGEVVALLRRVARPVTGGRDPVVALLEWTDGFQELSVLQRSIKEAIEARGIELHLAEVQQVVNRNGSSTSTAGRSTWRCATSTTPRPDPIRGPRSCSTRSCEPTRPAAQCSSPASSRTSSPAS